MIRRVMVGCVAAAVVLGMASVSRADDKSDVQAAAKKLADASNYSWTTTVENAGGGGPGSGKTEGKTEKDGFTSFSVSFQEQQFPIVIKGDKAVAKMDAGWMNSAELQKAADDAGGFSPELIMTFRISAFKAPAVLAKDIGDKMENVKKTADGYTADLAAATAKDLLSFRRPAGGAGANFPEITVKDAKGTVKFWVKDGVLSKMEVHLTGSRTFNDQENPVDQTATTEIKDVGTTKVTVADEAKKKLEAK